MSGQQQQNRQFGGRLAGPGGSRDSYFSPFADRLQPFRSAPQFGRTVTIGGRTYREVDDGAANVLVPVHDPRAAAELAKRREGYERAQSMAANPLGGAAYGLAAALGASPQDRDRALAVGASVDAVLSQATPRGAFGFSRAAPPKKALDGPALQRDRARFGEPTPTRQATYASATITQPALGSGTRASRSIKPPGWSGDGDKYNEARGHLYGKQLGGPGNDRRNIVTLTQKPTNAPDMRAFEDRVAGKVRNGEVVEYFVQPMYSGPGRAPDTILMMEYGSRGGMSARILENPAGRRK